MIVCGWCSHATEPGKCGYCGRDPAVPWVQRGDEPPPVTEERTTAGRPKLDASQTREKLRIAKKELGPGATNADLAELLGVDLRTLSRWQKVSD